jgi:hypothetical protein
VLALIMVPALFCWYIRRDQRKIRAIPQLA